MTPYDANGKTIFSLTRSHKALGNVWILTDGYNVTICEQKSGEAPTQGINLSRAAFNRAIDWYLKNQPAQKPKKTKHRPSRQQGK